MKRCHVLLGAVAAASLISACSPGEVTPLPDNEPLPIDALLTSSGVTASSRQNEFDRYQSEIRECMAAEGFEYFPAQIDQEVEIETLPTGELQSYAAAHGYGLTEALLPTASALDAIRAGVLPGHFEFDLSALGLPQIDPEMDQSDLYVLTLSPDEIEAYYTALDGPPFADEEFDGEPADLGCRGRIDEEAIADPRAPSWLDEATLLVEDRLQSAGGEFEQADQQWSACMAEQGFDQLETRLDAPESIRKGILNLVLLVTHPEAALHSGGIDKLHEHEMALAAADAVCYASVYRPAVRGIEHRIQTEVLTELGVLEA